MALDSASAPTTWFHDAKYEYDIWDKIFGAQGDSGHCGDSFQSYTSAPGIRRMPG
jgi:hypothetical protein